MLPKIKSFPLLRGESAFNDVFGVASARMYWYSSSIKLIKARAAFNRIAANWQKAASEESVADLGT
jgi:hypothetical protein